MRAIVAAVALLAAPAVAEVMEPTLNASEVAYAQAVLAKRAPLEEMADAGSSIEQCFVNVCSSATVRDSLVSYCKQKGYDGCDSLSYHNTYYNSGTYGLKTEFSYDTSNVDVKYSKANVFSTKWDNQLDVAQKQTFAHTVTKQTAQSWTNSQTKSISSSLTAEVTAGLPEVVQAKISSTISVGLDLTSTKGGETMTTQSWAESEDINIPPKTCALGCMTETDGAVVLPYSVAGLVQPHYDFGGKDYSHQCCYLRPGGANDCMGIPGGSGGWSQYHTPAIAVQLAASGGVQGCENFGTDGDDASWRSAGSFTGGMGFNVSIATVECGHNCTA